MDLLDNTGNDQNERDEILNKWKDKTPEELLKAKVESDLYIKTLERQKDEFRNDFLKMSEESKAQAKLQDLIDRLERRENTNDNTPTTREEHVEKPTFDRTELESLISTKIQETEMNKKKSDNFRMVQSKLKEEFGDNFQPVLQERMNQLGLTTEEINNLAMRSPTAFYNMIGMGQQRQGGEDFQSPPRNTQRSDSFSPKSPKRSWSFYQNMKKTDPKTYWDPKTQVQMHKDSSTLGDAFEDGDFRL
jgi:hypothetical protein